MRIKEEITIMTDENTEFPKEGPSHTDIGYGYTVEAKYIDDRPVQIKGYLLNQRWTCIELDSLKTSFPVYDKWSSELLKGTNLVSYEAAETLRWAFLSHVSASKIHADYLKTRIVQHKVTRSYSIEVLGEWKANPNKGEHI